MQPSERPWADLAAALEEHGVDASTRALDRRAIAHDASHYLMVPGIVIRPRSVDGVLRMLGVLAGAGIGCTFRSGGTSLSGQASGDLATIDTRTGFQRITVLDDGRRVQVEPGATVRAVNARLARHGRKLGPDPASEIAATIGGVIADNSSGMHCGITDNTYETLESAVIVLASGTVVDTARADADDRLAEDEPALHEGLAGLRDRLRAEPALVERIRLQYRMKNTMGYGLNSFLDADRPVDILGRLIVGSEGTLGFVASAVFRTVPVPVATATGLLVFDSLDAATGAIPALAGFGLGTIELLDAAALRVAQRLAVSELIDAIPIVDHAALLVEVNADDAAALDLRAEAFAAFLSAELPDAASTMTQDPARRAALWKVRKGIYPAIAGARPSGTTALLEDIAVPVERLLPTCRGLTELFARHAYGDSVIFGHAKDGNVHFLISERFDDPLGVARYRAFTEDLVDLVLANGGTLKAEHGTGRVMAPFVRRQFGDELYAAMVEVKRLCDPTGVLNPGVVISDDDASYTEHLKVTPTVEGEVDRCVECGYCEPVCPSRSLTLTPRQRIVLRREQQAAVARGDRQLARELAADYVYDGVQTCAVDGMCGTACPVGIDTGDLVRRLRRNQAPAPDRALWRGLASAWGPTTAVAGTALTVAKAVAPVADAASGLARAVVGSDRMPRYSADLPRGGRPRRSRPASDADAVFFPSCTGAMFAPVGEVSTMDAVLALAGRAGLELRVPDQIASLCCGTPWKSKGMADGADAMAASAVEALWVATDGGRLPVVCDAASCTEGLDRVVRATAASERGLRVEDAVAFIAREALPRLTTRQRLGTLVVHPTCSSTQLGLDAAVDAIATAVADEVVIPTDWGCCGFAGDRGMLHPELTAAATAAEAAEVATIDADAWVSLNRTCELGLSRATGREYAHLLQLLERATRVEP